MLLFHVISAINTRQSLLLQLRRFTQIGLPLCDGMDAIQIFIIFIKREIAIQQKQYFQWNNKLQEQLNASKGKRKIVSQGPHIKSIMANGP